MIMKTTDAEAHPSFSFWMTLLLGLDSETDPDGHCGRHDLDEPEDDRDADRIEYDGEHQAFGEECAGRSAE